MMRKILPLVIIILIIMGISGCSKKEKSRDISLEKKAPAKKKQKKSSERNLRIAVGGMITPKAGFVYYRQFLDYIGEKMDIHADFVDREDYAEINELVESGEVDVAFVCGGPYVDGHDQFGMELLVAPQAYGETVYYSYIIVPKDSPIKKFEELRDKSFAFTDSLSNTGKLVPTYMLVKMNETPDSFFKRYNFTGSHDESIKVVAEGVVDGAAVDSLIWEYVDRINPELTSRTKIIVKSSPYGIPPIVVRPGLDLEIKKKLKEILLNAHKDAKGKEILKGMMVDKFVPVNDSAYDSIREMKSWVKNGKRKE